MACAVVEGAEAEGAEAEGTGKAWVATCLSPQAQSASSEPWEPRRRLRAEERVGEE